MNRKGGLSKLSAAVILVAVALVAGVLLYEVYFTGQGTTTAQAASQAESAVNSAGGNPAGSFYATAQVSASVMSCTSASGTCTIQLANTGEANTQANGCSFSGKGSGTITPNPAEVQAGASVQIQCTESSGQGGVSGSTVTGSVYLSDGASVEWVGTWS